MAVSSSEDVGRSLRASRALRRVLVLLAVLTLARVPGASAHAVVSSWDDHVVQLSGSNFHRNVLESNSPWMVMFYAPVRLAWRSVSMRAPLFVACLHDPVSPCVLCLRLCVCAL